MMTENTGPTEAGIRELSGDVRDIGVALGDVLKRDKRRRTQMIVVAFSVAFDILLSVAIIFNSHETRQLVDELERTSNAAVTACLASNDSAVKQHQLWDGLLALPQPKGTPPTDPKTLAAFNKLLNDTFVQADCDKLKS